VTRYRWAVLAAGTLAAASYSAILPGLAVLAPALRDGYGLGLGGIGVVLAAATAGATLSLIPWGLLTDRLGERIVIGVGLTGCGAGLVGAAYASSFPVFVALLALAGLAGAAVNSASGRAVMHWFGAEQRGLALGIRQTAIPIGGAAAALVLPHFGARSGLIGLGASCVAASAIAVALLREGPRPVPEIGVALARPFRDGRIWRLAGGSALMLAPQLCLVGFLVVFLHERRGVSRGGAAGVFAAVQLLGIGARIAAGRWSDVLRDRIVPLRRIALVSVALVLFATAAVGAPLPLLVPLLVAAGVVGMSWNGLSFTAAAELAGRERSGAAIGLQQTVLAVAGSFMPPLFGAVVAATSWRAGFALVALFPLVGWLVLAPLGRR
jgi:sugar phosphate permease